MEQLFPALPPSSLHSTSAVLVVGLGKHGKFHSSVGVSWVPDLIGQPLSSAAARTPVCHWAAQQLSPATLGCASPSLALLWECAQEGPPATDPHDDCWPIRPERPHSNWGERLHSQWIRSGWKESIQKHRLLGRIAELLCSEQVQPELCLHC